MTAHRQWSYLQTLRRFGLDVREKLRPGSVAVRCPACPQPGVNMDPNWESRPVGEQYKDALFIAKDGNFVLCQHDKKLDEDELDALSGVNRERVEDAARLEGITVEEALERRKGFRYLY